MSKAANIINRNGVRASWIVVVRKESDEFENIYSRIFVRTW